MKENKYGIIISFILVLCTGLPPIWLPRDWLGSTYLLAIFGGCVLSLFICIVNYEIYKRKNLRAIAIADFSLEYKSKFLVNITTENKDTGKIEMNRREIIEMCSSIESVCEKEFEKIDICIDGMFIWNKKWKNLLIQYRRNLKENIYDKSCDLRMFIISVFHQYQIKDIEQELYKYMTDFVGYRDYEKELNTIRKWTYGQKLYELNFSAAPKNTDETNRDFKQKLKKTYSNK